MGPEVTAALKLRDEMSGQLQTAAERAKGSLGGIGTAALGVVGAAAAAGAAVVGFGLVAMQKTVDAGQAAYQMGEKFGLAGQQASSWLTVARHLGVDSDMLGSGFKFLAKNVEGLNLAFEATGKVGKVQSQVFTDIGINVMDANGHIKSANELMLESADVFARMPAGIEKTGLAMKLFGKQGMEMLPVLNQGRAGLEELMKQGLLTGEVMSGPQVEAAHKMFLAQQRLNSELTGFTTIVGTAVLPVAADFMAWLTGTGIPAIVAFARPIVAVLVPAFRSLVTEALPPLRTLFGLIQQGYGTVSGLAATFARWRTAMGPVITAGTLLEGTLGILVSQTGAASESMGGMGDTFDRLTATISRGARPILQDLSRIWREILLPAIGQLRDRLLTLEPRFAVMVEKVRPVIGVMLQLTHLALEGLAYVLKVVLPPAVNLLIGVWDTLMIAIGVLADTFMALWTLLDDLFHGRWGKLWDDVKRIFATAVGGIFSVLGSLVKTVTSFFGELIDNLVGKKGSIPALWNSVVGWFASLPEGILRAVVGLDRLLWQSGVDLINGLKNGIIAKWREFIGWLSGLVSQLPQPLRDALGIHSDSTVGMEIGRRFVAGIRSGIQSEWPGLKTHVAGLALGGPGGLGAASLSAAGGPSTKHYNLTLVGTPMVNDPESARRALQRMEFLGSAT